MTTLRRRDWTLPAFTASGGALPAPVPLLEVRCLPGERQKFGDFLAAPAP